MEMNIDSSLEFKGVKDGHEDDLYAEIRRQILLLTADDDEDLPENNPKSLGAAKRSSNSFKARCITGLQSSSYFNWWEDENTNSVPAWLASLWRNGTGVFIPQVVKSRRYYNLGRMNNERRIYKRVNQLS
ncbi:hypothetical protein SO802_017704 [Lithocarpus litseifolius]|uniref:Uncharacterized protein n=1 Tax=Lithocarpus litseifolius TaxID=425828 RepID=A0AAW2CIR9_9ROSI